MAALVSQRDLVVCVLVRERKLLADDQLEAVVRQWLADPERQLWDRVVDAARLSPAAAADFRAAADVMASETLIDPVGRRLRLLPLGLRRLLAPESVEEISISEQPTKRGGDTKASPTSTGSNAASRAAATEGLTPCDRFDILQVHAQGGLGVVFQARDHEIERTVALKQIKAQWADDDDSRARFLLEARVTGRLEHPGIVPIYALGADASGRPYYAMRFIRGESLMEVIARFHRGRASRSDAERMSELRKLLLRFLDVCHAVDYAHSKGVIHRDLKPSNIMLGKYGETLVVDWGLAKVIGSEEDVALTTRMVAARHGSDDPTGTVMGAAIGTPAYMSPEQAAGRHDELTPATDVFSLGATLYHLLTGVVPHEADADVAVSIAKAEYQSIVPPRERVPWLPRPLESICVKALATRPEERYLSARFLAEELDAWLADEPVHAHRESLGERTFRWMRAHRTFVIAFVAVDLVATAAIIAGVLGWNHLQAERTKAERARNRAQAESEHRDEQRRGSLAGSVQAAEQSADAELAAGRFAPALGFLNAASRSLGDEPTLADKRTRVDARRDAVRRLVQFQRAGERGEELAFFQHDAESRASLEEALDALGVLDGGDWWDRLPSEVLTAEQQGEFQESVYRKLILLAAAHAKETFKNLLTKRGEAEAREVLAVNELVQRFRAAESTRWHASYARFRLGEGVPLSAADLASPDNPADAYMLAAIWAIADQNAGVRSMLTRDDRDALEACKRKLRTAQALAPGDYWSHLLLAYVEMLQAGKGDLPLAQTHGHCVAAREALSHCLAIRPDHWFAYAERSAACRQEIEARRKARDETIPADWEPIDDLVRLMIHDSRFALELAGPNSEALWYGGFALLTAGQDEQAIDALLAAAELANRYDVETVPRLVDRETQQALPAAERLADSLIRQNDEEPRRRLLRATALVRLRKWDEAVADLDVALASSQAPPTAHSLRGEIRLHEGRFADARGEFEEALAAIPDNAPSLIGVAASFEGEGNAAAALDAYDRAKRAAKSPFERAAIELGRARVLITLGQLAEAKNAVLAARRSKPSCELSSTIAAAAKAKQEALADELRRIAAGPTPPPVDRPSALFRTLPLLNGGFELGLISHWNNDDVAGLAWHTVGAFHSSAEATDDAAHSGRRSLHIVAASPAPGAYGVTSQTFPADPASRYRITVWAKAKYLSANAVALALDDNVTRPLVTLPPGEYDWKRLTAEFDLTDSKAPLREGLKATTLRIVARASGEAWLDDLRIEAIEGATNPPTP